MCRHRGARGRPGPCTTGLTAWHPVSKHSREVRTWSGEQAPPAALLGKRQGDSLVGSGNRTDRCPTQGEAGQAGAGGGEERLACLWRRQKQEGVLHRERFVSIPRAGKKLLEYLVFIVSWGLREGV